jgi:hypothetical protein
MSLTSIAGQVGFNFRLLRVTIADDHSDTKLNSEFLKMYPVRDPISLRARK